MKALLGILLLVSLAGAARADEAGVVVTGEATLQPQLAAHLEGWLRKHNHHLVASPLDPDSINTLIDCFVLGDESCARSVVDKSSKSRTLVYARIDVSPNPADGTRDIVLVGYWLNKGGLHAIADRRHCEKCTEQSLRALADDLMASLAHLATPVGGEPEVRVDVIPVEHRRSHALPAAVIGSGAALAITGGVLLAINKKPSPTGPQQPTYSDYGPPGGVLLGVGLAAIGVGAYLWWRGDDRSTPVAAVSGRGAVVGWSGRF